VIANADTELDKSAISRSTLLAIYSMRARKWPNGDKVTVFVFDDRSKTHQKFCAKYLGIPPYHLRRNWRRLVFSGRASEPVKVESMEDMIASVRRTPGAIGYLAQNYIDESVHKLNVLQ
jgi:ABC-type phosphate transport system substrate-binding protein